MPEQASPYRPRRPARPEREAAPPSTMDRETVSAVLNALQAAAAAGMDSAAVIWSRKPDGVIVSVRVIEQRHGRSVNL